ncbi:MAG: hypothetical protein M1817_005961 [Caeruleum heppii]|nr:MAG: hypothetical protein M1817_005961 [Caeruleum heppii]
MSSPSPPSSPQAMLMTVDDSRSSLRQRSTVAAQRPDNLRRSTEPTIDVRSPPSTNPLPRRLRDSSTSATARGHGRSKSSASYLAAPPMTRAHSMPVVDAAGRMLWSSPSIRPSSPLGHSARYRNPARRSIEDAFSSSSGLYLYGADAVVPEDAELGSLPKPSQPLYPSISSGLAMQTAYTYPRRYRPSSPLRPLPQSATSAVNPAGLPSTQSSPLLSSTKFNEAYPTGLGYQASYSSNSSLPSTPTSTRSRSPSISSLETIPDSPDAEEAAVEAERIATLKAAADAVDGGNLSGDEARRGRNGTLGLSSFGSRDKKKRWSVCGAERRGDLDLETIWED